MIKTSRVTHASFGASEIAAVLCYPRPEPTELQSRMLELTSIGVDMIEFAGDKLIGRLGVLGKGCVGIVVRARTQGRLVALKVRRMDADRPDMRHEAEMLRLANSVGVGPKLLAQSKNFLVMEFINGLPLHRWIELLPERGSKRRTRRVIGRLFDDCFGLDQIHLDHGELSTATKNVLVERADRPRIVDFESASDKRRPSNVTSIAQYLLIGGRPAKRLRRIMDWRRTKSLIRALRGYKQHPDSDGFQMIKTAANI